MTNTPQNSSQTLNHTSVDEPDATTTPEWVQQVRKYTPSKYGGPLKAIRRECISCCSGSSAHVKDCISLSCHLWPYRFRAMPETAARQGKLVPPPPE